METAAEVVEKLKSMWKKQKQEQQKMIAVWKQISIK